LIENDSEALCPMNSGERFFCSKIMLCDTGLAQSALSAACDLPRIHRELEILQYIFAKTLILACWTGFPTVYKALKLLVYQNR